MAAGGAGVGSGGTSEAPSGAGGGSGGIPSAGGGSRGGSAPGGGAPGGILSLGGASSPASVRGSSVGSLPLVAISPMFSSMLSSSAFRASDHGPSLNLDQAVRSW